ncbi:MAG: DUF3397 domain-containing protein [Bacillaceae bacterium]|nr:DUF3397 domain-containing protein [Bacillaceae bacterium]
MMGLFITFFALLITLPIPVWIAAFVLARKIYKHPRRAIHTASDMTAFLFIFSVSACLYVIFEQSFLPWIIIFLILMLSAFLLFQWKTKQEVVFVKAFKGFLRLSFLLFSTLYVILICYGIFQRVGDI